MRVFLALEMPSAVCSEVADFQRDLGRMVQGVKWVEPKQFHVTLAFLGEVGEGDIPGLGLAVGSIVSGGVPLCLSLGDLAFFPGQRRPRVIALEFSKGERELKDLVRLAAGKFGDLGHLIDGRKPHPHFTLGRCREGTVLGDLPKSPQFKSFSADGVCLYESRLTPGGPIYRPLLRAVLGKKTG